MRLLIKMFFNFAYCFSHRSIAALLFQALETGQQTVCDKALFLIDLLDIFFVRPFEFLYFSLLYCLLYTSRCV